MHSYWPTRLQLAQSPPLPSQASQGTAPRPAHSGQPRLWLHMGQSTSSTSSSVTCWRTSLGCRLPTYVTTWILPGVLHQYAVGATSFLILAGVLLLLASTASGAGLLRLAPALVRNLVAAIFIFSAVRVGLSIAIIAFDLSPICYLIPVSLGIVRLAIEAGTRANGRLAAR